MVDMKEIFFPCITGKSFNELRTINTSYGNREIASNKTCNLSFFLCVGKETLTLKGIPRSIVGDARLPSKSGFFKDNVFQPLPS